MPGLDPVSAVSNLIDTVISRVVPDPTAQLQAKQAAAQLMMTGEIATLTAQAGIITAEANSANKLESSWRPMLMYTFMLIIFNNYFLAPYLQAMFHVGLQLAIPDMMWELLKLGVTGYIVGRSAEKMVMPHPTTGTSPIADIISTFKGN